MAVAKVGTQKVTKKKQTKKQILEERRKFRADLGADRDVMRTPNVEGMVVRWVNDENKSGRSRVQTLRARGWEVYNGADPEVAPPNGVTEANISLGDGAIMAVGTNQEGKSMRAILMVIPEEFYAADQQLKEEAIREKESTIFDLEKEQGMYGGIRIGNQ